MLSLVVNVSSKIKNEKARAVCILPTWPTQPWYAKAMEMLEKPPIHLKASKHLVCETYKNEIWQQYICFYDSRFRKLIHFVNFSCFRVNMRISKWPYFYIFPCIFRVFFAKISQYFTHINITYFYSKCRFYRKIE